MECTCRSWTTCWFLTGFRLAENGLGYPRPQHCADFMHDARNLANILVSSCKKASWANRFGRPAEHGAAFVSNTNGTRNQVSCPTTYWTAPKATSQLLRRDALLSSPPPARRRLATPSGTSCCDVRSIPDAKMLPCDQIKLPPRISLEQLTFPSYSSCPRQPPKPTPTPTPKPAPEPARTPGPRGWCADRTMRIADL